LLESTGIKETFGVRAGSVDVKNIVSVRKVEEEEAKSRKASNERSYG
jgi:hypothetical protein